MSSVLKFVDDLVEQTSPADDAPRVEMQEGGLSKVRRPITTEEDKAAKLMYGKSMKELSIGKRNEVRDRIKKKKVDPVTFQEYLDDFKKMAADPDYKPKFVKPLKGVGSSAQRDRARAEAKKTIEGFESKSF
jgi:hypothetical protein